MDHTKHHELDETLELFYHLREKHQLDLQSLQAHEPAVPPETLAQLEAQGLISRKADRIDLTEEGFRRAEGIIRRHRLAERLLTDVLHMSLEQVEAGACEFEHIVAEEIAESICTLLGHPRTCPHGTPIPEGACCRQAATECPTAIVSLPEAPLGTWVRIAYISSFGDERQHRLGQFGIAPGSLIKVHQLKPSIVVMLETTRLAMEESVARTIFVWKKWEEEPKPAATGQRGARLRFWRR